MNPNASFNDYNTDKLKINAVFTHPALLKAVALNMDIASMGEFYIYDKDGKEVKNHPLLKKFENPNPFQTKQQFLADYVLWNIIGTDYLYTVNKGEDSDYTKQYFLDSSKIEWSKEIEKNCDKIILSKGAEKEMLDQKIRYRYNDGTYIDIKLKDISIITDLTNGVGNWYKSPSRLDALYKVITNSEEALNATNVNLRYTAKFLVAGKHNPENYTDTPMGEDEKKSIDESMNKEGKSVYAVKSMVDIKRFVSDMRSLQLDEIYMNQYYIISSMLGINRELAEAYLKDGAKFNNKAVGLSQHITYTIQPKMNALANDRTKRFGLEEKGERVVISYDHLPVMQRDAKEQAEVTKINSETLLNYIDAGVELDEINELLDTKFTKLDYEKIRESKLQTSQEQGESNTDTEKE